MADVARQPSEFPKDVVGQLRPYLPYAGLLLVSLALALVLVRLELRMQLALLFVVPAILVGALIMKNTWAGVYLYFLYDFLRPYDFIPALLPLRLAMIIELVTLVSWVNRLRAKGFKINWTVFNWHFLGFVSLALISIFTSANNRMAFNVFQGLGVIFVMFLISTEVVDTQRRLYRIIWLLLLIHFYFALRGIYNYAVLHNITGGMRTSGAVGTGFVGDENDFALTINVMIPFAFFIVVTAARRLERIVALVILVTYVIAVIFSFSRGGTVGLIFVILYCILSAKHKLRSLAFTAILASVFFAVAPASYWAEVRTITDTQETTAQSRFRYWMAALRMYAAHPVMGVGAGNGGLYVPQYITGVPDPGREWGRAFHGTIPQLVAELGTLGLIFYLGMLITAVRMLLKVNRQLPLGDYTDPSRLIVSSIGGGMVGYFVCATFLSTLYYPQLWMLYTLTNMLYHITSGQRQDLKTEKPSLHRAGMSIQTRR